MIISPSKIVIDTKNLAFGDSEPQSIQIQMECFEDLSTDTPVISVSVISGPFSASITSNTSKPVLTLTLDKAIAMVQNGVDNIIALNVNGTVQNVSVVFMFAEDYKPENWFNSGPNDLVAEKAFSFREVLFGTKYRTTDLNIRFKMLFEYASLLYFRMTDIAGKFETKRKIKDIVDCGLLAGSMPKNCASTVTRDANGDITTISLTYQNTDEAYTRAFYTYEVLPVVIDFSANTDELYTIPLSTKQKKFLKQVDIWRMSETGNKRYKICTVTLNRSNISIQSGLGCLITIPMISGWTVTE